MREGWCFSSNLWGGEKVHSTERLFLCVPSLIVYIVLCCPLQHLSPTQWTALDTGLPNPSTSNCILFYFFPGDTNSNIKSSAQHIFGYISLLAFFLPFDHICKVCLGPDTQVNEGTSRCIIHTWSCRGERMISFSGRLSNIYVQGSYPWPNYFHSKFTPDVK